MLEQIHIVDIRILKLIQRLPKAIHPLMVACTVIGQPVVILGIITVFALWTIGIKQFLLAKVSVILAIALLISPLLKLVFQRSRPDIIFTTIDQPESYSFPSGHAFSSLLIFGFLAYLAFTRLSPPWNIIVAAVLGILVILISTSRVYLGVHYPTDVLIGWILGLVILVATIKLSGV